TSFRLPNLADIRMGVCVVPDLMSFRPDTPDETGITLRVLANQEKCRRNVQRLQLVENLCRVNIGRPVIDRQRNHLFFISGSSDDIGRWEVVVALIKSEARPRVDLERALARGRNS